MFSKLALSLLALAVSASCSQWPMTSNLNAADPTNYHGFAPPVHTLRQVARTDRYTKFSHPLYPGYSARIKRIDNWCDEEVGAYTGYIDVQARHLFFYFFESRNDPSQDDVVLWSNGGPGSSSSLGLFMELGPCRITNATENPRPFKEAWNANANIFFVDQPIGVGYSYAEYGETVSSAEEGAVDIARFMVLFFENFPQFKGRGFHLSGESYSGRYLPLYGAAIYDQNTELVEAGMTPINLSSIIIGNGMVDSHTMFPSYYEFSCTHNTDATPFLPINTCVHVKKAAKLCAKLIKENCEDVLDQMNCEHAFAYCDAELMELPEIYKFNPYNVAKPCPNYPDCYPEQQAIVDYLSRDDIREMLGVDPAVPTPYQGSSETVWNAFMYKGMDLQRTATAHVAALLERGVRVLVYTGIDDFSCNHIGGWSWISALEWTGGKAFVDAETRDYVVDGKVAGETRSAGKLTWVTINGAGHLVPYDKPKEALAMVNRWLAEEAL